MSFIDRLSAHALGRPVPQGTIGAQLMPDLPEKFLTNILDAQDAAPEIKRIGTGEGAYGHYTHVSSLIDACARMHALAALDDRTIREVVTGGHRVMWKIGRAVESHIRDQYLASTNRRMAFGRWKCVCEQSEHVGHHPVGRSCPHCFGHLDDYHEYTLFDHDNWIKGNPDLLAMLQDWMVPTEIKSMNPDEFKALKAPKGDHVFQVGHYHRMLELEGFKVHRYAVIIYCIKEFKYGSPYKEFHVDMRTPAIQTILNESLTVAASIKRARTEAVIPERTLCSSHSCTRAKACPFVVNCFSR